MKKSFILLTLFIALNTLAQGYKHFTIEQGLPSNRIYKILQDHDGFIWIATDKGLSKFDGAYFKNFTIGNGLPSNDIWEILITENNKIWFFTRSNKIGYILNDKIHSFKAQHNEFLYPTTISTNLKTVIFRSYNDNYQLINQKWTAQPKYHINDAFDMPIKVLHPKVDYFISKQNSKNPNEILISLKDAKDRNLFSTKLSHTGFFLNGQINDSLMLLNTQNEFQILNLNRFKIYNLSNQQFFKPHIFTRFLATPQDIQISSENYWATLDHNYQLKNIRIFDKRLNLSTLFRDRQGNFWGTTYAKGIYLFPSNSLTEKTYLTQRPVQFLKLMQGKIFAAVLNKGIYQYDAKEDQFKMFVKNNDYFFDMLYENDNNFGILANTSTLVKQDKKITEYYRIGKRVIQLKKGYAISERSVVSEFDPNLKLRQTYHLEGVNTLIYKAPYIIAGTPIGLFKLQNGKIGKIKLSSKEILPILSLNQIDHKIIVGTDGLGAYIEKSPNHFEFIPETKNLIINDIFVKDNQFWLGTQKGLLHFEYRMNRPFFNKIMRKTDGLISDHINNVIVFKHKIFTSNFSGVATVAENQAANLPLQKIYFEAVKYNNQNLDSLHNKVVYQKNNNLLFNIGVIDYSGQEHNQFSYQLLPVQKKWIKINSQNINFNSLEPLHYIFKIKVVNPYGQELQKSYRFTIKPLWWQTTWAKILLVSLILSLIFIIGFTTRRKELRKQRDKLIAQKQMAEFELHALRSQMNPHFVFNSLNAIQYYINDQNFDKSETYLVKFSRLIRMIFEFSRKKTIKLEEEINLLKSYLNLEKMRFGSQFDFCFHLDPKLDLSQTEIPTLLLQPIVENAVNHGIFHKKGKGTICLEFIYHSKHTYEVVIKDDGIGLEKSKQINRNSLKKHRSRSTQILKDRINLLNLSEKWRITYELINAKKDQQTPYNTIVKLKITRL